MMYNDVVYRAHQTHCECSADVLLSKSNNRCALIAQCNRLLLLLLLLKKEYYTIEMYVWLEYFIIALLSVQQFNITFLFRFQFQNRWNIQTFGLSHNLPRLCVRSLTDRSDKRHSAMKLKVKLNFIDFIRLLASFLIFFFSLAYFMTLLFRFVHKNQS